MFAKISAVRRTQRACADIELWRIVADALNHDLISHRGEQDKTIEITLA